jgi:hypothetical protein
MITCMRLREWHYRLDQGSMITCMRFREWHDRTSQITENVTFSADGESEVPKTGSRRGLHASTISGSTDRHAT